MTDLHHHLKAQVLRSRFPRGAVELTCGTCLGQGRWLQLASHIDCPPCDGVGIWLVPVEKPPNPEHKGLRHVSLSKLLRDERNLIRVSREDHARHHSAESFRIEPDEDALEFARWAGLEWRLEGRKVA